MTVVREFEVNSAIPREVTRFPLKLYRLLEVTFEREITVPRLGLNFAKIDYWRKMEESNGHL